MGQTAVDAMFACIKEDLLEAYASIMMGTMSDESKKAVAPDEISKIADKWFPVIEGRLPHDGFVNGLAFPTMGDLAILNIAKAFVPFGACAKMSGYDHVAKWPKFAAH